MKNKSLWMLVIVSAVMLAGCKNTDGQKVTEPEVQIQEESTEIQEQPQPEEAVYPEETPSEAEQQQEEGFSFADVANREFYFSSGAGGWYTVLHIHEDGTFDGHYQDSDMGVTGDEYPNGTLYYCDFNGKFTEPERVDDTTYTFEIESIEYPLGSGEEIKDGYYYYYSSAYGLDGAKHLYMYLPGAKLADLPEEYRRWVGYYDLESVSVTELTYYGLYNIEEENGFSSYVISDAADLIRTKLSETEDEAIALQARLQDAQSQTELNEISGEIYAVWDDALNAVWGILKENLDENTMKALTEDERAWIAEKEAAAQAAGEEYEGGSMQAMAVNQEAARLTRERVYLLSGYLQ